MKYSLTAIISFTVGMANVLIAQTESGQSVSLPIHEGKDTLYAKVLSDPYRILEEDTSELVRNWYTSQANRTNSLMSRIAHRDSLAARIYELQTSANVRSSLPKSANNLLFFNRSYIKEFYDELVCVDLSTDDEKVLLRSDSLYKQSAEDYTIGFFEPSPDGSMVVVGVSASSTEVATLHVFSTKEMKLLTDTIERVSGGQIQWLPDGRGFLYTQMGDSDQKNDYYKNRRLRWHQLGADAEQDLVVFSRELYPELKLTSEALPRVYMFPGSNQLFVSIKEGTLPYLSLYASPLDQALARKGVWATVFSATNQIKRFSIYRDTLVYLGTKDYSNGKIVATSWSNFSENERVLLSDEEAIIRDMTQTRDGFYIKYLRNGISQLSKLDKKNLQKVQEVPSPFLGNITISGSDFVGDPIRLTDGLYFGIYSWNKGYGIYHYNPEQKQVEKKGLRPAGAFENPEGLTVEEIEIPSHDGTMVPLSIIYSDTLQLNGSNPTMLAGYGAYGATLEPYFDVSLLSWFERGGIYAVAHVRGGGEKGDDWYQAGLKKTKPNSWKDFIACAEYLIEKKYTSPSTLAAYTGSAGGIMAGRAITERPELFQAAVISVGVMNPLRFEYTMNTANVPEFGTVKDSAEASYLLEMDPYMHIQEDKEYPAVLLSAAMNDERVDAWQPGKFVARMQQVNEDKPALLRIDYEGGHYPNDYGAYANELADYYSFLFWQLGHPDFQLETNTDSVKGSE